VNAKQFTKFLEELGACSEARRWAKGKTLAVVWKTCKRGDWMSWLLIFAEGRRGWPEWEAVTGARMAGRDAHCEARARGFTTKAAIKHGADAIRKCIPTPYKGKP